MAEREIFHRVRESVEVITEAREGLICFSCLSRNSQFKMCLLWAVVPLLLCRSLSRKTAVTKFCTELTEAAAQNAD